MEYSSGPLLLSSKDKNRMMDFLSDVLDFDADSVADCVRRDSLYLKIIFSFKVKKEADLKEIMSKYNFFLYRKSALNISVEKLDLIQNNTNKILTISDIDHRLWQFEYIISEAADV
jgi:hypothetical protein